MKTKSKREVEFRVLLQKYRPVGRIRLTGVMIPESGVDGLLVSLILEMLVDGCLVAAAAWAVFYR